ncbi:MAG: cytochrome c oxidase subunit II [Halobacteria archaeon]|nr:cytochrome c oxidase subunit II [Halobacteria archaeon]
MVTTGIEPHALASLVDLVANAPVAHAADVKSSKETFDQIFKVFLGLGTLVGIVVITYTLYNAYKFRAGREVDEEKVAERPELGEKPKGKAGGRKLFTSFALSAIIVVSLIVWTYGSLLYIHDTPDEHMQDELNVTVEGYRFGWTFKYPNGYSQPGTLRVPEGTLVNLDVTSRDVWHNFGIPKLRAKADAIPGQTTTTWFIANNTGTYMAHCYELCGAGHSQMDAKVIVMEENKFERWYANTTQEGTA